MLTLRQLPTCSKTPNSSSASCSLAATLCARMILAGLWMLLTSLCAELLSHGMLKRHCVMMRQVQQSVVAHSDAHPFGETSVRPCSAASSLRAANLLTS